MRKQRLGITDELHYYDNYPSMFPLSPAPTFGVRESETLTLAALAPLGPDYLALMRKGFAGQWMNVMPHEGKANGAYMNGSAYDVHPYLLLNHSDNYQGLTTHRARMGTRGSHAADARGAAVREFAVFDLHRRIGLDRQ